MSVDWSARQDQNEALAIREITVRPTSPSSPQALTLVSPSQNFTDVLQPFCNGPKTEVALINTVQVYCYEDTRIMKAFPQILKVMSLGRCPRIVLTAVAGVVQQRLYIRFSYYLLASEGCQAPGQAALFAGDCASCQGTANRPSYRQLYTDMHAISSSCRNKIATTRMRSDD